MKKLEILKNSICETIDNAYKANMDVPEIHKFLSDIYDSDKTLVMPLTVEETYILRCLLHINECYGEEYLNSLELEFSLETVLKEINSVLLSYTDFVEFDKPLFEYFCGEDDDEISLFDEELDELSYETICQLRMLNIYNLKDLELYSDEFLEEFISKEDLNKICSYIKYVEEYNREILDEHKPRTREK
ncbi:MAG: hypothetical protein K6G37_00980 [Bacilli bacterium]|nr:hypothetical protein [Bacilli bacterium]